MTAVEIDQGSHTWDPALLAADLRLRFLAAHARLRQAQLILAHRDYIFPKTLDECLDEAEVEVWAALDELEGGTEWRQTLRVPNSRSIYRQPRPALSVVPEPLPKAVRWPVGWEKAVTWETTALIALGYTTEEVGERLHIAAETVRSRLHVAFRLHNVPNQPALVHKAWQDGLMQRPEIVALQEPHLRPIYPPRCEVLPPQRKRVLGLLAEGLDYKEIAGVLDIGFTGAKSHVALLFRDMGLAGTSSAGVVHRAWQLGWLPISASADS